MGLLLGNLCTNILNVQHVHENVCKCDFMLESYASISYHVESP